VTGRQNGRITYRGRINPGPRKGSRISRECPRCGASPYDRCFRIRSWVADQDHPDGGFYTARANLMHEERRAEPRESATEDPRTALRREIASLIRKKLGGNDRVALARWYGSPHRTVLDLRAKRDELAAMEDLPW
jgi:hypothetical protein